MVKTYLWMVLLLAINWGGFIWLVSRVLRKERREEKQSK